MGEDRVLAGPVAGFGGQVFGAVGLGPAGLALVVHPGGFLHHQVRRLQLHPGLGQRVLDGLVLADRAAEHLALVRVLGRACQRCPTQTNGLGGDQDALGVHAVQDVLEALVFFADAVLGGHLQAVDEELVGVDALAAHLLDFAHLDLATVQVGVEQAQAFGALAFFQRLGARQQQNLAGHLRGGDEHLLPMHHIVRALAPGKTLQLEGVQPGVGLGHGKAGLVLASDQRRQHALLLRVAAEHHHRMQAKDVHVHRRRARQAGAGGGDGVHHQRRLGDAQAGAAVGFGHGDAQPAGVGQRAVEVVGKAPLTVLAQPVVGVERRADALDGVLNLLLLGGEGEVHAGVAAQVAGGRITLSGDSL